MRVFQLEGFERFVQSLPGTSLVDQWGSRVAKVGGKVFSLFGLSEDPGCIVFKCTEDSFVVLTGIEGVKQAPHFAKRQWVSVPQVPDIPDDEIEAYLRRSYHLISQGLTKKLRQELGFPIE